MLITITYRIKKLIQPIVRIFDRYLLTYCYCLKSDYIAVSRC